jgi:hypothetical protein
MTQEWFEMRDIRRRALDAAVWIPLRAAQTIDERGKSGHLGHRKEFFGLGSVAVPVEQRSLAEKLSWSDLGLLHSHSPHVEKGEYVPTEVFKDRGLVGVRLVLEQAGNRKEHHEWHLNQDLVVALALKREGDTWLAIDEGYLPVARLHRSPTAAPILLEIRSEFLKDYLCARGMGLFTSAYRSRTEVAEDASHIAWPTSGLAEETGGASWKGNVHEIHEGGMPFGSSTAVFHLSRTDIDPAEDVPKLGLPTDDNVKSANWTEEAKGRKLFRIVGELWRGEWVAPSLHSPRVRGDHLPSTVAFITDAQGTRETADTLQEGGRWLWFRPEVVEALLSRRAGELAWYSRDTGGLSCSPNYRVHFGVNGLGLVNVYAKDIALLPEWQQRVWGGFNVGPEGGVSAELLAAQVEAEPADTQAPEAFLPWALRTLDKTAAAKFGHRFFREHDQQADLLRRSHRFRATDIQGLFSLAKDIARLTADSIDTASLQHVVKPPKTEKWGSLKTVEKLLALKIGAASASTLMQPLFGAYELRLADAHLEGTELEESLVKCNVDSTASPVLKGFQLLDSCVSTLYAIVEVLKQFDTSATA